MYVFLKDFAIEEVFKRKSTTNFLWQIIDVRRVVRTSFLRVVYIFSRYFPKVIGDIVITNALGEQAY